MFKLVHSLYTYVAGRKSQHVSDIPFDELEAQLQALEEEEEEMELAAQSLAQTGSQTVNGTNTKTEDRSTYQDETSSHAQAQRTHSQVCCEDQTQSVQLLSQNGNEKNNGGEILPTNMLEKEQIHGCEIYFDLCEHRVGTVTDLVGDNGLIDDKYAFKSKCYENGKLEKGLRVTYVVFRSSCEQTWHVHRILSAVDENWDEKALKTEMEVVKKSGVINVNLIVKVIQRNEQEILVEPKIKFNLENVESQFIPREGDWLKINALAEVDETVQNFVGDVLQVRTIAPVRLRSFPSFVVEWDERHMEGVIDKDVWFSKDECEPEYVPIVEDPVAVEAIESSQGPYAWRAISVVSLSDTRCKPGNLKEDLKDSKNKLDESATTDICKKGIKIPRAIDFGYVSVGQTKDVTIEVSNVGDTNHVLLRGRFHGKKSESQITVVSGIGDGYIIRPGETIRCCFRVSGKFIGISKELYMFTFRGFKLKCFLNMEVQDKSILALIKHEKGHSGKKQKDLYAAAWQRQFGAKKANFLHGVKPKKPPAFIPVRTESYIVPSCMWEAILGEENCENSNAKIIERLEQTEPCLAAELIFSNYCRRFHALLYCEEIALNIQLHRYDMENVVFSFVGEYLSLEVPGLAEKRPSLLIGDRVKVVSSTTPNVEYEGYVHKVCATDVWLKFHENFHVAYNSEVCSVQFVYGRGPIRRCHTAVDLAVKHLGENVLFPKCLKLQKPQVNLCDGKEEVANLAYHRNNMWKHPQLKMKIQHPKIVNGIPEYAETDKQFLPALPPPKIVEEPVKLMWFNPTLNHYQKEAVRSALKGEARPLPYVIFGPPGTGKTITLVETILQIYSLISDSRILVATPSNSSANLIAERLLSSKLLLPGDLVRLVAYHCLDEGTLPESLLPYSTSCDISAAPPNSYNPMSYKLKTSSNATVLGRHRITVGTCIALGQLYTMGFPPGHFTHVCVDEAGQATEPEVMIPLGFLDQKWGQAILAGDPLQLGPVVNSRVCARFGFDYSYLARLLDRFPYQRDSTSFPSTGGYNPRLVTRLVMNYRSLPEILELPSSLFYDSQLQPQVTYSDYEGDILKRLDNLELLPKRDAPHPPSIVFHGVRGINYQDSDCPSWFNPQELVQVIYYLQDLLDAGLTCDDIGVITPYQKQVQKLRILLSLLDMPIPKIGSVEEFQGQERMVIILSAVRSTSKMIQTDIRHALGFVACPQRLNVALTRARALLIILGNPHILSRDIYWQKTLAYCIEHDSFIGCDLPRAFVDLTAENEQCENGTEMQDRNENEELQDLVNIIKSRK